MSLKNLRLLQIANPISESRHLACYIHLGGRRREERYLTVFVGAGRGGELVAFTGSWIGNWAASNL